MTSKKHTLDSNRAFNGALYWLDLLYQSEQLPSHLDYSTQLSKRLGKRYACVAYEELQVVLERRSKRLAIEFIYAFISDMSWIKSRKFRRRVTPGKVAARVLLSKELENNKKEMQRLAITGGYEKK